MSKMNKKRATVLILAASLASTVAIGGTLAYLTDTATKTNTIDVVTDLGVDVEEPEWTPDDNDDPLLPGDTKYKDPCITTTNDVFARLKITFTDENNNQITDSGKLTKIWQTIKYDAGYDPDNPDGNQLKEGTSYSTEDINALSLSSTNTANFVESGSANGTYYYYYKASDNNFVLAKDTTSPYLFTNIVIPSDWSNAHVDPALGGTGKFNIVIEVQSVQAENQTATTLTAVENIFAAQTWS